MIEHLRLKIDARSDFSQHEALLRTLEYTAFCDVADLISPLQALRCIEGNLYAVIYELVKATFLIDVQLSILHMTLESTGGKGAHEDRVLRVGRNIREATTAGDLAIQVGGIDITILIHLRKSEDTGVESTMIEETEEIGLIHHRNRIEVCTEIAALRRHTADESGF